MALTVDGIPVSGSTGHTTYSRNRYGAYRRSRTKPVNPTSPQQVLIRAAFRAAIDAWTNDLSPAQRAGWANWAAVVPWLNKAGQSVNLAPQVAFTRTYQWAIYNNRTPILDAPLINDLGTINVPTIHVEADDPPSPTAVVTIDAPLLTNSWQVTGGVVSLMLSAGANPSTNFPPRRFCLFGRAVVGVTPATPVTIAVDGGFPFTLQPGQKVWGKVSALDPENRLTVTQLTSPAIVTAP